jgi:hypothetical protein
MGCLLPALRAIGRFCFAGIAGHHRGCMTPGPCLGGLFSRGRFVTLRIVRTTRISPLGNDALLIKPVRLDVGWPRV